MNARRLARRVLGYWVWWRATLLVATAACVVVSIAWEPGRIVFALAAFVPATLLITLIGTRLGQARSDMARLQTRLDKSNKTVAALRRRVAALEAGSTTTGFGFDVGEPLGPATGMTAIAVLPGDAPWARSIVHRLRRQSWSGFDCVLVTPTLAPQVGDAAHDLVSEDPRFTVIEHPGDRDGALAAALEHASTDVICLIDDRAQIGADHLGDMFLRARQLDDDPRAVAVVSRACVPWAHEAPLRYRIGGPEWEATIAGGSIAGPIDRFRAWLAGGQGLETAIGATLDEGGDVLFERPVPTHGSVVDPALVSRLEAVTGVLRDAVTARVAGDEVRSRDLLAGIDEPDRRIARAVDLEALVPERSPVALMAVRDVGRALGGFPTSPETVRPPSEPAIVVRDRPLVTDRRRRSDLLNDALVLNPSAGYHMAELGPLAQELQRRGHRVAVVVAEQHWPITGPALRRWELPVAALPADPQWVTSSRVWVTLNDWAQVTQPVIAAAHRAGVPVVAKVEGVQDFEDVDVPWERRPYRHSDLVLCQGENDRAALAGTRTEIVGSSRLERIWLDDPRPAPNHELAVVNVNFTYGVLEDQREAWLSGVLDACASAGMPPVLSLHPAERDNPLYAGLPVSDAPMSTILRSSSVLISRFSTVPFEAMALGVPFVYHNPHGELVPTFHEPGQGFDITTSVGELSAAVDRTRKLQATYRDHCREFFCRQIDVDPSVPAHRRAADAVERILR